MSIISPRMRKRACACAYAQNNERTQCKNKNKVINRRETANVCAVVKIKIKRQTEIDHPIRFRKAFSQRKNQRQETRAQCYVCIWQCGKNKLRV